MARYLKGPKMKSKKVIKPMSARMNNKFTMKLGFVVTWIGLFYLFR